MSNLKHIIKLALKEDIGSGDITSRLIIPPEKRVKAVILAKENGLISGLDVAGAVFKAADQKIWFRSTISDGAKVKAGTVLARIKGPARSILKAERVALNFLGRLSGIATLTNRFVQAVRAYKVKIMDTRKTTPGLRILEKYAVRCGGGVNHRMGLWDQILIKDNHLLVAGRWSLVSGKRILPEIISKIKRVKPKGVKIEVEVKNLHQFKQALSAEPDIIMLDNMPLKDIKNAVAIRNHTLNTRYKIPATRYKRVLLEVSGRVNLNNVRQIAATEVEMISVGELTHSAKVLDMSLEVF